MIPRAYIQAPDLRQVEQDLIICRALCDLFNGAALRDRIAFRGGTAIHKLLFTRPLRYSEDIDLVQTRAEPIGATVDAIRDALSWLGKCNRTQAGHSMHLVFRFASETDPQSTLKLKVEINTREHAGLNGTATLGNPAPMPFPNYAPRNIQGCCPDILMTLKKSDLHSSLRVSCDGLRVSAKKIIEWSRQCAAA